MYRYELMALLSIKGIGIQTIHRLIRHFGSLEVLLQHVRKNTVYEQTGIKATKACHLALEQFDAKAYEGALCKESVNLITFMDARYPKSLKMLETYPLLLHYKGAVELINNSLLGVAVVGSRRISPYGQRVAFELGRFLGEYKLPVVSGLAYGVDYEVHSGVIKSGGTPIGVVANGLETIYPKSHKKLAKEIVQHGVLVTEEFLYSELAAYKFPIRNRLISGMSQVIVVVEAEEKSGSLITARHGLEQGKTVYAVPGSIYSATSRGTNQLIAEGAIPLLNFQQLLEEYSFDLPRHSLIEDKEVMGDLVDSLEVKIAKKIIERDFMSLDELSEEMKLPIAKLSSILMQMEIEEKVRCLDGNKYTLL